MSCGSDATLGGWVDLLVENKDRKCESCGRPAKDHESSWIHNVTKISITVKDDGEKVEDPDTDSQGLVMWARCKQCSQRTTVSAPQIPLAGPRLSLGFCLAGTRLERHFAPIHRVRLSFLWL